MNIQEENARRVVTILRTKPSWAPVLGSRWKRIPGDISDLCNNCGAHYVAHTDDLCPQPAEPVVSAVAGEL